MGLAVVTPMLALRYITDDLGLSWRYWPPKVSMIPPRCRS